MKNKTMKILIVIILLIPSLAISAPKQYGSLRVSEVSSIYDGDTFFASVDGWPDIIGKRIGIRVNGIDTPEIRGKCEKEKILAREAKQFAVSMLRAGKVITLKNMMRGKYFRIAADVDIDGYSLGLSLINAKLAVEYHGKKKNKNWCEQ